jgi:hypothetical protein
LLGILKSWKLALLDEIWYAELQGEQQIWNFVLKNSFFDSFYSQGHKDALYSLKITVLSCTFCVMKLKLNSQCSIILWFTMCCDPLIVENTI